MKYVSIDIETTGLDETTHQILSVGACIEDSSKPNLGFEEVPKFHAVITTQQLTGSLFALSLNSKLIKTISSFVNAKTLEEKEEIELESGMQFLELKDLAYKFSSWLKENNFEPDPYNNKIYITAAGKNFGSFDKKFLELVPGWNKFIKIRSRILDPAILFVDWKKDESLPGLGECKKRINLPEIVTHNALEDSWDVITLLRPSYKDL